MSRVWPAAVTVLTLAVVGVPLALPFVGLAFTPDGWAGLRDLPRLLQLARNTLTLAGGVVLLDLPVGIGLALLLYRTDLPGRRVLRGLLVVSLFIPLPFVTTAWQAALDLAGKVPGAPVAGAWRPWLTGLPMAVWVHAVAGLPWVVWLIGQGLRSVERDAEEAALLSAGPGTVCRTVTLPRAGAALAAAVLWLVVQTATEITVTDMTLVRTYAEEVYSQIASPEVAAGASPQAMLARAVAAAAPWVAALLLVVAVCAGCWQRTSPPLTPGPEPPPLFRFGRRAILASIVAGVPVILILAVPLIALVLKLGTVGSEGAWSSAAAGRYLTQAATIHGHTIAANVIAAFAVGAVTGVLALLACWLARERGWLRAALLVSVAAAWAVPAPVVGIGLKETIDRVVDVEQGITGTTLLRSVLYDGPSLLPVAWAWLVRLWPFAVAFLWPTVRLIPRELFELTKLGGATAGREFREVLWPAARPAVSAAAVAVAVLALGELGASKLVATPDAPSFAHDVFAQMHYGPGNTLAAMCLLLLAACMLPLAVLGVLSRFPIRSVRNTPTPNPEQF
jgi:iron(III) transport system permease protein